VVLPVVFSISLFLIADIDSPRGWILTALVSLERSGPGEVTTVEDRPFALIGGETS
jgi:hypothetical protein